MNIDRDEMIREAKAFYWRRWFKAGIEAEYSADFAIEQIEKFLAEKSDQVATRSQLTKNEDSRID